jgi:hypothetical protein
MGALEGGAGRRAAALAAAARRNHAPSEPLPRGYRARLAGLHARAVGGLLVAGGLLAIAGAGALLLLPAAWPVWLAAEGTFLALWHARKRRLDRHEDAASPADHCALAALERFKASVPVISRTASSYDMVGLWFHGAPLEEIRRENVRELLAYGFGYRTT